MSEQTDIYDCWLIVRLREVLRRCYGRTFVEVYYRGRRVPR